MPSMPTIHDDIRTRRLKGLRRMVGDTPLVSVRLRYRGRECRVHAKAEYLNLTGSIKDRTAFHICRTAIEQGALRPDDTIVEATSGNTGIAFSALGAALAADSSAPALALRGGCQLHGSRLSTDGDATAVGAAPDARAEHARAEPWPSSECDAGRAGRVRLELPEARAFARQHQHQQPAEPPTRDGAGDAHRRPTLRRPR